MQFMERCLRTDAENLKVAMLEETYGELLLPEDAYPIIETLSALYQVVEGTMGHGLDENYSKLIKSYTDNLRALPNHMSNVYGVKMSITWKEHIVCAHLEEWLDIHKTGLALYSEQAGESIHHKYKVRTWRHFKVPPGHAK